MSTLPWKNWVRAKIIHSLEEKGITPVDLRIDALGFSGVELSQVRMGEPALTLERMTVGYRLPGLISGNLHAVTLHGGALSAKETETGWVIEGLEAWKHRGDGQKVPSVAIPVSQESLQRLPVEVVSLEASVLQLAAKQWELRGLLSGRFTRSSGELIIKSQGLTFTRGSDVLATGPLELSLTLDTKSQIWNGRWTLKDVLLTSESLSLPLLAGGGELRLNADGLVLDGTISDKTKTYRAAFALDYRLKAAEKSSLTVSELRMPWGGGEVGARAVTIPLGGGKKPIHLTLNVTRVPIESLMKTLTSDAATATGVVSGSVPVTLSPQGKIRVGKGSLASENPGVIALAPETIPGDNQQVTLVRDVLKNLHYNVLSLTLDMAPDDTLSVVLAVEGNNPDVQSGRPIKLNVNLSGDLLNLLLQNMKLMTDPTKFIDESTHEKTSD